MSTPERLRGGQMGRLTAVGPGERLGSPSSASRALRSGQLDPPQASRTEPARTRAASRTRGPENPPRGSRRRPRPTGGRSVVGELDVEDTGGRGEYLLAPVLATAGHALSDARCRRPSHRGPRARTHRPARPFWGLEFQGLKRSKPPRSRPLARQSASVQELRPQRGPDGFDADLSPARRDQRDPHRQAETLANKGAFCAFGEGPPRSPADGRSRTASDLH